MLEAPQCSINTLSRQADQIREFFLRNRQRVPVTRIKNRIEEIREFLRQSSIRTQKAVVLDHTYKLPQTLVDLSQKKMVERDAALEHQHERVKWHISDRTIAQRDGVEAPQLSF